MIFFLFILLLHMSLTNSFGPLLADTSFHPNKLRHGSIYFFCFIRFFRNGYENRGKLSIHEYLVSISFVSMAEILMADLPNANHSHEFYLNTLNLVMSQFEVLLCNI